MFHVYCGAVHAGFVDQRQAAGTKGRRKLGLFLGMLFKELSQWWGAGSGSKSIAALVAILHS